MVNVLAAPDMLTAALGTDEHGFSRLVGWLDGWVADNTGIDAVVQHGYTTPPRVCGAAAMIPREQLIERIRRSFAVVTHGGPGLIMDARAQGMLPIVVPRDPARREHVDDHQLRFCTRIAALGWIHLAETEAELRRHLDTARKDPAAYRISAGAPSVPQAARNMERVLMEVLRSPPGGMRWRRIGHVMRMMRPKGGRLRTGSVWTAKSS